MAEFKVPVVEVSIEPHDNADALEIANIKGYQCIVRKGEYQTGDLAVYIPEQAIVPEGILDNMGLWDREKCKGKLAGPNGDRVKAVKLRGKVSQGLLYPNTRNLDKGQCAAEEYGITKWEPPIPTQMAGQVANVHGYTLKYDINNIKNYPEVVDYLIENEVKVEITEKIHGTWASIGFYPETIHPEMFGNGNIVITSKGLSQKGLAFKNVPDNDQNLYVRTFREIFNDNSSGMDMMGGVLEMLKTVIDDADDLDYQSPIFLLGEIFGQGVQDLTYGVQKPQFRLFDVFIGYPRADMGGRYLTAFELSQLQDVFPAISYVPVLYDGILTREIIEEYTDGMDTIQGNNIREGIIIKPFRDIITVGELDRVILKSVSNDYLFRKNGTEYN